MIATNDNNHDYNMRDCIKNAWAPPSLQYFSSRFVNGCWWFAEKIRKRSKTIVVYRHVSDRETPVVRDKDLKLLYTLLDLHNIILSFVLLSLRLFLSTSSSVLFLSLFVSSSSNLCYQNVWLYRLLLLTRALVYRDSMRQAQFSRSIVVNRSGMCQAKRVTSIHAYSYSMCQTKCIRRTDR